MTPEPEPQATSVPGRPTTTRNRSSAESRDRLLAAAAQLFAEHGYEDTTVREIGRSAEVDPTLIARYFGSKAALYLESLRHVSSAIDRPPLNLSDADAVIELLERVRRNGLTPTLYAAIRPLDDQELQSAANEILRDRVIEPAASSARRAGLPEPELRAELITAALAGIVISRISRALPTLAEASSEELAELVADLISHMTGDLND